MVNQLAVGTENLLYANMYDGGDVPSNITTGYTISVGDTFFGNKEAFDTDWIELKVVEGETCFSDLKGATISPVNDTYMFLYGSDGTFLGYNRDGGRGNGYSELVYNATQTGSVFIEVDTYFFAEQGG